MKMFVLAILTAICLSSVSAEVILGGGVSSVHQLPNLPSTFDKIQNTGHITIEVTQGADSDQIEWEVDDAWHPYLEPEPTVSSDGTLVESSSPPRGVELICRVGVPCKNVIRVQTSQLASVIVEEPGVVHGATGSHFDLDGTFEATLDGKGTIILSVSANHLSINNNGANGVISLHDGAAESALINGAYGSATFAFKDMQIQRTECHLNRAAEAFVSAVQELTGSISVCGTIYYAGDPTTVDVEIKDNEDCAYVEKLIERIDGTGSSKVVEIDIDEFSGISHRGNFEIELVQGEFTGKAEWEIDEGWEPYMQMTNRGYHGELSLILSRDHLASIYKCPEGVSCANKVRVQTPSLEGVQVDGQGSVIAAEGSVFSSDYFSASVRPGTIQLAIESQYISASCDYEGEIQLSGTGGGGTFENSDDCVIDARDLQMNEVRVFNYGSADATVRVASKLTAVTLGSGNIYYIGEPGSKVIEEGSGGGKVIQIEE